MCTGVHPPQVQPELPADIKQGSHVLVCLLGLTPAVCTETVWVLKQNEEPPTHVVLVATAQAWRAAECPTPGTGQSLSKALFDLAKLVPCYQLIGLDQADSVRGAAEDVVHEDDQRALAALVERIGRWVFTAKAKLHVAVGGGRASMGTITTDVLKAVAAALQAPSYRVSQVLVEAPRGIENDPNFAKFLYPGDGSGPFYPQVYDAENNDWKKDFEEVEARAVTLRLVDILPSGTNPTPSLQVGCAHAGNQALVMKLSAGTGGHRISVLDASSDPPTRIHDFVPSGPGSPSGNVPADTTGMTPMTFAWWWWVLNEAQQFETVPVQNGSAFEPAALQAAMGRLLQAVAKVCDGKQLPADQDPLQVLGSARAGEWTQAAATARQMAEGGAAGPLPNWARAFETTRCRARTAVAHALGETFVRRLMPPPRVPKWSLPGKVTVDRTQEPA